MNRLGLWGGRNVRSMNRPRFQAAAALVDVVPSLVGSPVINGQSGGASTSLQCSLVVPAGMGPRSAAIFGFIGMENASGSNQPTFAGQALDAIVPGTFTGAVATPVAALYGLRLPSAGAYNFVWTGVDIRSFEVCAWFYNDVDPASYLVDAASTYANSANSAAVSGALTTTRKGVILSVAGAQGVDMTPSTPSGSALTEDFDSITESGSSATTHASVVAARIDATTPGSFSWTHTFTGTGAGTGDGRALAAFCLVGKG